MSTATRLVLGATVVVVLVMTIYGMTSLRQREELITDALVRETETLANAMQVVANNAIRNGQMASLNRVLGRVLEDPDMAAVAVLDSAGRVIAGAPADAPSCVGSALDDLATPTELHVWGDCGGRVRLVVLPLRAPAQALIIARRTTVVERDMASSRRRILVTSVALAALGSLAILLILRFALTRPLSQIMEGVRQLGGPATPRPVRAPGAGKELRALALAFNEMVERLEGKRRTLVREADERVELERRLRRAEAFAAMGRLTGGVAHELGSPLGVISVRADAIQADPEVGPPARVHAEEIAREVERIARLVRELTHVARKDGLAEDRVVLGEVVDQVWSSVRRDCEEAGIEVDIRHAEPEPIVIGDGRLLRHAVHNVVLNALQALRKHRGERRLRVRTGRAGAAARITIDDSGPGIAPEHYAHVAEPFFTTKDVGEGSGLGLSITAGIVEEHGGTLGLDPSPLGGLRACIELPLAPPSPAETE
jgi:two-component system NtrC family sensor kinase